MAGVNWGSVVTIRQKGMYIIIKGRMGVSTEQVRKCTLAGEQVCRKRGGGCVEVEKHLKNSAGEPLPFAQRRRMENIFRSGV